MTLSAIVPPAIDPTPIFAHFRGNHGTELLTAAVSEFDIFGRLAAGPELEEALHSELGLAPRAAAVLFTALRAMDLLTSDADGRLNLTPLSREHLVPGSPFDVSGYIRLAADNPGVKEMVARLKSNRPANAESEKGAAFIFRDGIESAMEREESARFLTMSLAGRAKNVAPHLARVVDLQSCRTLLDVAGGSGLYTVACVQAHPHLRAIVLDRPEVLKVAAEMVHAYGVADRIDLVAGDMFGDPLPAADALLLSNVLHDWDVPECVKLLKRCAAALPQGGRLFIHDVFLNDALDGPLPIALYSAALFALTEGRAYSEAEYRNWLAACGFTPSDHVATLIHCGVLTAMKN